MVLSSSASHVQEHALSGTIVWSFFSKAFLLSYFVYLPVPESPQYFTPSIALPSLKERAQYKTLVAKHCLFLLHLNRIEAHSMRFYHWDQYFPNELDKSAKWLLEFLRVTANNKGCGNRIKRLNGNILRIDIISWQFTLHYCFKDHTF